MDSKRTELFEHTAIFAAVWTLAVPTIITQLINIIYNFADTWYVGRTNNPAMVATMGVCMPIFVIMAAVANLFGIGGSSMIARFLGMKKEKEAEATFSFCLYGGLLAAVVYGLLVFLLRKKLIWIVGGDAASYSYIYDYMFWTMIVGAIPTVGNVLCGHLIRSTGAAKVAGFGMSMGGVLNILLDPLFMFVLLPKGQEVRGAAIATMLSNTAALVYFLVYLLRHRDNPIYSVDPRLISKTKGYRMDIIMIGIPAALQTTFAMVSNIFANTLVVGFGSVAVAGMGIAKKINMLCFNTILGLTQGVLPLIGYCYGAKNYQRMRKTIRFTGICAVVFGSACAVLFHFCAAPMARFFIEDGTSIEYAAGFLKILSCTAPLCGFSYLMNMVFQATGKKWSSFLLAILRKGILDVPTMFILKQTIGVFGVAWATPFADGLSAFISIGMYIAFLHHLKEGLEPTYTN